MADYQIYERPSSVSEAISHIEELVYEFVDQYEGEADREPAEFIIDCWNIVKNLSLIHI